MNYSLLIVLFVVIVNSLTGEAEEIFGVEVSDMVGETLETDKVDAELGAKQKVLVSIREIEIQIAINERDWIDLFRKLVNTDMSIISALQFDFSSLNTQNFKNINNNPDLKDLISNSDWNIISGGLKNYTKLMETFKFGKILWNRKFVQNPFQHFLTRISKEDKRYLVIKKLTKHFKDASVAVSKAQLEVASITKKLAKDLKPQQEASKTTLAELRKLDLLSVRNDKKNVEKQVKKTIKELEMLLKAVEDFNKGSVVTKFFKPKRPWFDNLIEQLEGVEKAHKELEINLKQIYPY